jgi:deoxyadenosine/deoxycytidine kinase
MSILTESSNQNIEIISISIEGNIGSGKSTLLEYLRFKYQSNTSIIFLKEPVEEWETIKDENGKTMLEHFYADQTKYSFAFQMMAYISRLALLKETVDSIKKKNIDLNLNTNNNIIKKKYIIITERSLYTDKMVFAQMLFDSGKLEYLQFQIYLKWFDSFIKEYPVSKIIYVKTNPEICHYRISKRCRQGEDIIPLEYLDHCDTYHEKMVVSDYFSTISKLVLNGNININLQENDEEEMENWFYQINDFVNQN